MITESAPVPARKQDSRVWCGPAALQAVLARWGILRSQEELAEMLGTTETEGTKPHRIANVVADLGLAAEERAYLSIDDLIHATEQGVPVICNVHMHGGGHYVVVTDCTDGIVTYFDPDDGRYHQLDAQAWNHLWYDLRDGNQIVRCGIAIAPPGHKAKESRQVPMETQPTPPGPTPLPTALLDLPDVRQRDNFACGAACSCAVGLYFGVGPTTLDGWKEALHTTVQDSTKPQRIIDYFQALGCTVEARQGMTIDDLRDYWRREMPVIVCLQEYGVPSKQASFLYGHYVICIGVDLGMVFVQDPSLQNVISADHVDSHGMSDSLLSLAEKFLHEKSPAHLSASVDEFRTFLRSRGQHDLYWTTRDLVAVLRIQSKQLGITGADNVPGRMMIDEATWLRVWHDRDSDGAPYVHFGIAIGAPPQRESRRAVGTARTLLREALELQSVEPMAPLQALDYFRSLLPMLGVDPMRWMDDLRRRAFTLAVATNDEMLSRVQDILTQRLSTGEKISDAPHEIEKTLDLMGVSDMPEGYGENVVRTSLMDSFNEGLQRELNQVTDTFPVWTYSNPNDSRSRPEHAAKNGQHYPSSVPFNAVRGTEAKDVCQCRCVMIPRDKWTWQEMKARGARIAEGYDDPTE